MSAKVKNALYTKQYNRVQLLRLLRQKPLSRAELARQTGLTRAAISLITEELIEQGMIRESALVSEPHTRGRTPVLLALRGDAAYAIGIRLTRSLCHIGLCDFLGVPLAQTQVPLGKTAAQTVDVMVRTVQALIERTGIPFEKLLGVGVSAPGPLDAVTGTILNPPDFSLFKNFPIAAVLAKSLGLPVYLENDANAAALRNYMDADFEGKENFLLLIVDSGVGSGVISQGRLLRSGGFTCELGHTSIDYRGPRCVCGNRGCLEVFASTGRLLSHFPGYDSWDALMASDDAPAALLQEAEYLAAAIVNFTNVMRLDAVLLCGDLQSQCGRLGPMIQQCIQGRSLSLGDHMPAVLPALKDDGNPVREACSIVFGNYLELCSRT